MATTTLSLFTFRATSLLEIGLGFVEHRVEIEKRTIDLSFELKFEKTCKVIHTIINFLNIKY